MKSWLKAGLIWSGSAFILISLYIIISSFIQGGLQCPTIHGDAKFGCDIFSFLWNWIYVIILSAIAFIPGSLIALIISKFKSKQK